MDIPHFSRTLFFFVLLLSWHFSLEAQVRTLPNSLEIRSSSISGSTVLKLLNEMNTTGYDISFDEQENLAIAETNVGTRFFIQKGGNVGIGTTNPLGQLEIQNINNTTDLNYMLVLHNASNTPGSSSLISFSGSEAEPGVGGFNPGVFGYVRGSGFVWKQTNGSGDPPTTMSLNSGNLNVTGTVTATKFIGDGSMLTGISGGSSLWTESGGNVYRSSGNVGVGVSDPEEALHVSGSVRADDGEFQSWGAIVLHPDVDQSGDDIVRFVNSAGETSMEVYGDGRVGIGGPPLFNTGLSVTKNINITNGSLVIDGPDNNTIGFLTRAGNDLRLTAYQPGSSLVLQTSSTSRVFINGDGQVGIGTSAIPAAYKLAIDGRVICENVRVQNSTAWPDFVFEHDYHLPALKEIESFIQKEKHLPDMPSAEKVQAEGIDVALMQNKLLQKVEELTLYTIQQQKLIEAQQSQIEALDKQLQKAIQLIEKQ